MAVSKENLDDYRRYSRLSQDQLLQIAAERSFADLHHPDQTAPTSTAVPTHTDSNPYRRPLNPPGVSHVQNCANPPTALSNFLYKPLNIDVSPLQYLIMYGDDKALMELVYHQPKSLIAPNDEGWLALHEAAYYGQLRCLRILISAFPETVNRFASEHQTALLLAAERGNVSCVDLLLRHGADPNIANKYRDTPLLKACGHPSEAVVELLLAAGARVNRSCDQGMTALHEACRLGHLNLCSRLLQAGANLHAKNVYGIQPLFIAAQHGHLDVLHLLEKKGADVNGDAGDGASPLYEACKNGHVSTVEVLLALNADANLPLKSGLLPLHVAVQNDHIRIVSMLIPITKDASIEDSGISPLHVAAERDLDDILELLIESGFDVNAQLSRQRSKMFEDRRSTALYFAVHNGNLEAAEMLLEAGADPNLDVFNPLLFAVRLGWMDMAELLLSYGANVNAQMPTQMLSFPSAILLGMECLPMLKLLLDNGCDAQSCFECPYGQNVHPALQPFRHPVEEMRVGGIVPLQLCTQFCEAVSSSALCRASGLIISVLLDYVSHVHLCSRLLSTLDSCSDWALIKLKALPPHPLMQLCRLKIRSLVGVQRLKLLRTLPLPARLIQFLHYEVHRFFL